jgi:uncharacterized Zn finger protein (UPF0148 family)
MDVFRIRKTREVGSTGSSMGTLDSIHQDQVRGLHTSDIQRDELTLKLKTLQQQRETLSNSTELTEIVKCSQIDRQIQEVEDELSKTNPVEEYYMKNVDILLDYYGKETSSVTQSTPLPKDAHTFMKFFSTNTPAVDTGLSKKQIFDEYVTRMKLSNGPEATQLLTEHCPACNVAREEISSEGILVCPSCGSEEYALVVSDFPSFRDPPKDRNNYAYKKINHLNEILNQFQAKESTIIPEEVMNEVILEIKKRRIDNIADMSEEDIRQILKKLGRSKYYEHRAHILSRLNGNPPPTITPEIEEKVRAMFQEIQAPFLLYCPNDRTNFLSYSYILYKFFELLDLDEYKVFFPLLKSRDRLIAHDTIWAKICDYLNWEFIRSV